MPESPCVLSVATCECGAKRLCRTGPTWRLGWSGLILDSTMFVHGLPEPMTEEQHFRLLHRECQWNQVTPS